MSQPYDFEKIEEKWLNKWQQAGVFNTNLEDTKKPKFYNLVMFPYPSAAALHIGHAYTYSGADAYGRFKRHFGYNVLQPMGFDAFGIHGENYAIKVNRHPSDVLEENVVNFKRQMDRLGPMFDWSHSVNTTYPDYYKWTQWIFVQMYKHGLAERKTSQVNWCPSCKTVLSDEQVIQGKCERCGTVTEKKEMLQWFFLITKYAQKLLDNHEKMDWSQKTIQAQKNWIGRSEGALITFQTEDEEGNPIPEELTVFSTRADTLYGATFIVVSTKHSLLKRVAGQYVEKVDRFIKKTESQTDLDAQKEKTGEFIGLYARNPLSGERIPIYVANYVLSSYGTGALMGVPAHDERDYAFAKEYNLPITQVIEAESLPYEGEGKLMNSDSYTGMESSIVREKIIEKLEKDQMGSFKIEYKLRDWLISRQRYWGPPIPVVYCDDCGIVVVEDLPVFLPNVEDFKPKGDGKSPLAAIESFVNTTCPKCGGKARRETDVLDNFVDSAWYFLRYPSVGINDVAFEKEHTKHWLPVDMYIGGQEHAVLHLMYTRFLVMALHDMGYLAFDEPFNKFRVNGLILKDGAKMSKSKGNVVNPDDYIKAYGADVLRMYLLFLGPYSIGGDFSDKNIIGIVRFRDRFLSMLDLKTTQTKTSVDTSILQGYINKVTEEIDNLRYNTAIAALMEYVNWVYKQYTKIAKDELAKIKKDFVIMVSVFTPFIAEEMWEMLGNADFVLDQEWPHIAAVKVKKINLPVQVNGKVRGFVDTDADIEEKDALAKALTQESIKKYVADGTIKKTIFVKNKILNIITA